MFPIIIKFGARISSASIKQQRARTAQKAALTVCSSGTEPDVSMSRMLHCHYTCASQSYSCFSLVMKNNRTKKKFTIRGYAMRCNTKSPLLAALALLLQSSLQRRRKRRIHPLQQLLRVCGVPSTAV